MSITEIQQLQSQPDNTVAAKERRSLRDIQAEEAELQAEAEFMKWWTAEEERIRIENDGMAAYLLRPQSQSQHSHGGRHKKPAAAAAASTTAEGRSEPGPRALRRKRGGAPGRHGRV